MAKGRVETFDRLQWATTSAVLAMIANVNRDPRKTGPFRARDFDPYAKRCRNGVPITPDNIEDLKVFVPGESP